MINRVERFAEVYRYCTSQTGMVHIPSNGMEHSKP